MARKITRKKITTKEEFINLLLKARKIDQYGNKNNFGRSDLRNCDFIGVDFTQLTNEDYIKIYNLDEEEAYRYRLNDSKNEARMIFIDFTGSVFDNCNLNRVDLAGSIFDKTTIINCNFSEAYLHKSSWVNVNFFILENDESSKKTTFKNCNLVFLIVDKNTLRQMRKLESSTVVITDEYLNENSRLNWYENNSRINW